MAQSKKGMISEIDFWQWLAVRDRTASLQTHFLLAVRDRTASKKCSYRLAVRE